MTDAFEANPRAVIGGNEPPLAERLAIETADMKTRTERLIGGVDRAAVTDDATNGAAIELAKTIADHVKAIDFARVAAKEPHLAAGRAVDAHFKALVAPLDAAKTKVVALIDAYRRKIDAEREAARIKANAEARAAREAAENAERDRLAAEASARKAEETARAAGDDAAAERAAKERAERELAAEIEAGQRRAEADRLDREAKAAAAPVIARSEYGASASGRKVTKGEISDVSALAKHLIKADPAGLIIALQPIVDRLVRAKLTAIPGVTITTDTQTIVR